MLANECTAIKRETLKLVPTNVEIINNKKIDPRKQNLKWGFRNRSFSDLLAMSTLITGGRWNTDGLWHTVAVQLLKLILVVN